MNPLQKYFRQPKLYVSLPSKGLYYTPGTLQGDPNNVPIFAMTGMDEIIMKTPDALFSGEATIKLIESCCPYIKVGGNVPSLDLDVLLVAIRSATYGENLSVSHTCKNCGTENDYDIKLSSVIDQYQNKKFNNSLEIDNLIINFRPMNYSEVSKFNIENFKLQKTLGQLDQVEDEERQSYLDQIYQSLSLIQVNAFLSSIESIKTPDEIVTDREFIKEWLLNSVNTTYQLIKNKLEENKKEWEMPKFKIECSTCNTKDDIEISLDQSNFFG